MCHMKEMTLSTNEMTRVIEWYRKNKRELPWRDTEDPYDVWLSEVMLQQTRIEAVKDRFVAFKKELPNIAALAECDDDRLMRLWEGMGYYSRARNLKKCAQVLVAQYDGSLPQDYKVLQRLPGIGPYTAGAIASIAYDFPVPAVDGNVLRVIARRFAIRNDIRKPETKKSVEHLLLNALTNHIPASDFNQGLMEIGETICIPNGNPDCDQCPLQETCLTHRNQLYKEIPYRSPLKKRRIVERTLFILRDGDRFLLHKRPDSGLLAGLYEFIGVDQKLSKEETVQAIQKMGFVPLKIKNLPDSKHTFTHLEWHMCAYEIQIAEIDHFTNDRSYIIATKKELSEKAIPSAFKAYIDWYALRD